MICHGVILGGFLWLVSPVECAPVDCSMVRQFVGDKRPTSRVQIEGLRAKARLAGFVVTPAIEAEVRKCYPRYHRVKR